MAVDYGTETWIRNLEILASVLYLNCVWQLGLALWFVDATAGWFSIGVGVTLAVVASLAMFGTLIFNHAPTLFPYATLTKRDIAKLGILALFSPLVPVFETLDRCVPFLDRFLSWVFGTQRPSILFYFETSGGERLLPLAHWGAAGFTVLMVRYLAPIVANLCMMQLTIGSTADAEIADNVILAPNRLYLQVSGMSLVAILPLMFCRRMLGAPFRISVLLCLMFGAFLTSIMPIRFTSVRSLWAWIRLGSLWFDSDVHLLPFAVLSPWLLLPIATQTRLVASAKWLRWIVPRALAGSTLALLILLCRGCYIALELWLFWAILFVLQRELDDIWRMNRHLDLIGLLSWLSNGHDSANKLRVANRHLAARFLVSTAPHRCEGLRESAVAARVFALCGLDCDPALNQVRDNSSASAPGAGDRAFGPHLVQPELRAFSLSALRDVLGLSLDAQLNDDTAEHSFLNEPVQNARAFLDAELFYKLRRRRDRALYILVLACVWALPLFALAVVYTIIYPIIGTLHEYVLSDKTLPWPNRIPALVYAVLLGVALTEMPAMFRLVRAWMLLLYRNQWFAFATEVEDRHQYPLAPFLADYAASNARATAFRELCAQQALPLPLCRLVASLLPTSEALISRHDPLPFGDLEPWRLRAFASVVDLPSFGLREDASDDELEQ